jgi:lipid-A-disaccharide synthase
MAAAEVELALDMTQHAVVGLWEVIRKYWHFRRIFRRLLDLAIEREPHAIICIDFSGFNLRFGRAVRNYARSLRGTFGNWDPFIVQYVSPQVWASRPQRAFQLARNLDLLLSIIPFEKQWYAARTPKLQVEFVGHPLLDRYGSCLPAITAAGEGTGGGVGQQSGSTVLLLPGSRRGELMRHLPVMVEALARIQSAKPGIAAKLVLPHKDLCDLARRLVTLPRDMTVQIGNLDSALAGADVAIASTGTVTLECALFLVPTVAIYKTSWSTYRIGKQLIQVKNLAMPNLLASQEVFPEFIQDAATPEAISRAVLALLDNPARRAEIQAQLAKVVATLGSPGASERAAEAIVNLVESHPRPLRAALR